MGNCVHVTGVSLGSSLRDFATNIEVAGVRFRVERRGSDGSLALAQAMIKELDGKVDAIGLGGVNLAYRLGNLCYPIKEAEILSLSAQLTPVVDGHFIKEFWEPALIKNLVGRGCLVVKGQNILVTSALDRYPLALGLEQLGADVKIGDALLALKLPILFPSLKTFKAAAVVAMPFLSKLPLRYLYPLGKRQEVKKQGWDFVFRKITMVAGDFHLINRRLPRDLRGKTIITSTLTESDRVELRNRGARDIFSLGLTINGRSFGANIMDAMLTGAANKRVFGSTDKQTVLSIFAQQFLGQAEIG